MFPFPQIPLTIELSPDYSWVAMDAPSRRDEPPAPGLLAPTVSHSSNDSSMFIIRVRYYVHVVLCFGMLHRAISMKLPFLLKRTTKALLEASTPTPNAFSQASQHQVRQAGQTR